MIELFGQAYTVERLRQLNGSMEQLAGARLCETLDGKARGMRAVDVWTGSGLRFTILPDRGMDIGAAEFCGKPLAWISPALGTPGQYEPAGHGWLRTFGGGLLTTCGLTNFGQPGQDGDEVLGLHGRISHIPAQQVRISAGWQGEDYFIAIEGEVRQAVIFGENLLLIRRITTRLGSRRLQVEDTVRNEGFRPAPFMLLYHCNFGFPLVSPESTLSLPPGTVRPRDEAAAGGMQDFTRFSPPDPGHMEQLFYHTLEPDANGMVTATLTNTSLTFGAYLRYRAAELPAFSEWKMMGAGEYVCGLEPCTVHETPRSQLRQEGRLRMLAPGEEAHLYLEFGVV